MELLVAPKREMREENPLRPVFPEKKTVVTPPLPFVEEKEENPVYPNVILPPQERGYIKTSNYDFF